MMKGFSIDLRKYCMFLYVIYAISIFLQFTENTLMLGLFTTTIAYFMTTMRMEAAKDTIYASHLQWLHRTFWIGMGVYLPIAVIIATGIIITCTDILSIVSSVARGDASGLMTGINEYIEENMKKVTLISMASMSPVVLWWSKRCYTGYLLAKEGKPVEKVKTWL